MANTNNLVMELLDRNNNKVSIKVPEVKGDLTEVQIANFMKETIGSGIFVSNEGFPVTKIGAAKRVEISTTQYNLPVSK